VFEFKSGAQDYKAAIHQLKCYSAALRPSFAGPILVWGVIESGDAAAAVRAIRHAREQSGDIPSSDFWLFSPAVAIPEILELLGIGVPETSGAHQSGGGR
jgi:hypothetical protein